GVLVFGDAGAYFLQGGKNVGAGRVTGGQEIKDVYERHAVPTDGAAPEVGGGSRGFVGPVLFFGLIPAMIKKAPGRGVSVSGDEPDLFGDIVKGLRGGFNQLQVLSIERGGHVDAVEPNLLGVSLLMPEAAFGCSRLPMELGAQQFRGEEITGLVLELIQ